MALLTTGIWASLRCDELLRLRWKDIKLKKRSKQVDYAVIKLTRSKTDIDRGGSSVAIQRLKSSICPIRWLRRLRREEKPKSARELVFPFMKRYCVAWLLKAVAGAHGRNVHHYSTHSLRRGGITLRAELGFSLPEIQQHARHKNPSTTMAYIHLPSDHALARLQRANQMVKHK
jgi:integrase